MGFPLIEVDGFAFYASNTNDSFTAILNDLGIIITNTNTIISQSTLTNTTLNSMLTSLANINTNITAVNTKLNTTNTNLTTLHTDLTTTNSTLNTISTQLAQVVTNGGIANLLLGKFQFIPTVGGQLRTTLV